MPLLEALDVMRHRATGWKNYYFSMAASFILLWVVIYPGLLLVKGVTAKEAAIIPFMALVLGFPMLLVACTVTYPVFKFLYPKTGGPHIARTTLSGGATIAFFFAASTAMFYLTGGYESLVYAGRYVYPMAAATSVLACLIYWYVTR